MYWPGIEVMTIHFLRIIGPFNCQHFQRPLPVSASVTPVHSTMGAPEGKLGIVTICKGGLRSPQNPPASPSGFVVPGVPRAMYFTNHGKPWLKPTTMRHLSRILLTGILSEHPQWNAKLTQWHTWLKWDQWILRTYKSTRRTSNVAMSCRQHVERPKLLGQLGPLICVFVFLVFWEWPFVSSLSGRWNITKKKKTNLSLF